MAWLSITGLYNYRPDIFDLMVLPQVSDFSDPTMLIDNIEPINRQALIDNILYTLMDVGLVYTDPEFLKLQIGLWSRINQKVWSDVWETMLYKYNPIWNKDGEIVETRNTQSSETENWDNSQKIEDDGEGTETGTSAATSVRDEKTLNKVTGFDSDTLRDESAAEFAANNTDNGSTDISRTDKNTRDISDKRAGAREGVESEEYRRKESGNIGVTTTQAMIKEQREIVQMNIYKVITDSFMDRFCLMLY